MSNKIEYIRNVYPDILLMDDFDDCVIGICNRFGQDPIVAYDYNLVINKMVNEWEMDIDEALEYYEFNQIGAWVGDKTPCFVEVL